MLLLGTTLHNFHPCPIQLSQSSALIQVGWVSQSEQPVHLPLAAERTWLLALSWLSLSSRIHTYRESCSRQFEFRNARRVVLINVAASDCDRSGKLKVMRVLLDLTAKQVVIHWIKSAPCARHYGGFNCPGGAAQSHKRLIVALANSLILW